MLKNVSADPKSRNPMSYKHPQCMKGLLSNTVPFQASTVIFSFHAFHAHFDPRLKNSEKSQRDRFYNASRRIIAMISFQEMVIFAYVVKLISKCNSH